MFSNLFSRSQPKNLLAKVQRLPQTDEVWEGSCFPARFWIHPKRKPAYRPHVFFLVSDRDQIVTVDLSDEPLTPDQVWHMLLKAMHKPGKGAGPKRRPRLLAFADEELVEHLAPLLSEIDVQCVYQEELPSLTPALRGLERFWQEGHPSPPRLLGIEGISTPLLGNIFAYAADFYDLKPWQKVSYEVPIKVRVPANANPRYVIVMGTAGESFGLMVYERLEELFHLLSGKDPRQYKSQMTWVSLTYDVVSSLAFEDLEAIETYQWSVASEQAYPSIVRFTTLPAIFPPNRQDLIWLEGAFPILIDYFSHHLALDDQGFVKPFEYTLSVETLNGPEQAYLGIPVNGRGRIQA